ncbi:CBS domain-containing protein [Desulfocurvus vexinensis]|uniref:CBS domain-containing protein n=1 Tax=Desulfocurvus vexinensis TaxID=399548 RepID=UPI0004916458|nr:CBS domain-containing protein [Desulfocurvus vexinensis]
MNGLVKDYTVPVDKFPRLSDSATFAEAVLALDKAQEEFASGKREQRIMLVFDNANKIVGKLSPLDVVRGLEPDFDKLVDAQASSFVSSGYVIDSMKSQALLWSTPLDDLCSTAKNIKVKDFIRKPSASQVIEAGETLNIAFHRFVLFRHDSLFVMDDHRLVGLLRFSDVYREIARRIKDVCGV